MIRQICRYILKDEIELSDKRVSKMCDKIYQTELKNNDFILRINGFYGALNEAITKNLTILAVAKNKLDCELVVCLKKDGCHSFTIFLNGGKYFKNKTSRPRLYFKFENKTTIYIQDILMVDNDIGNGSIALAALINYAKANGAKEITGLLMDKDNTERREHFYKKFGFKIDGINLSLKLE